MRNPISKKMHEIKNYCRVNYALDGRISDEYEEEWTSRARSLVLDEIRKCIPEPKVITALNQENTVSELGLGYNAAISDMRKLLSVEEGNSGAKS